MEMLTWLGQMFDGVWYMGEMSCVYPACILIYSAFGFRAALGDTDPLSPLQMLAHI